MFAIQRGNLFYRNGTNCWGDKASAKTWETEEQANAIVSHWTNKKTVLGGFAVGEQKNIPTYSENGRMTGYVVVDNPSPAKVVSL